jgi:antitoxin HicB
MMKEKNIDDYLALPYTRELIPEPEGGWFVRIKELPGCMSQGDTPEDALAMIADAMEGWLETALAHNHPIPVPRDDLDYSGKFVVRVPRSMHRKLAEAAQADGVSLNQWIVAALAVALGMGRGEPFDQASGDAAKLLLQVYRVSSPDQYTQLEKVVRDWAKENLYSAGEEPK